MQEILAEIGARLASRSYTSEAAVREGIVVPILRSLGWDTFDPAQVRPEHPNPAGRVDYALMHRSGRPIVLIEVKAVGRSLDGDRQLFGYCFEEGVPLAVLTDGRSWNFYLPAGVGRVDERRFYSLQLDDRSPEEAERILHRYLARASIEDRSALQHAREDHDKALNSREAKAALPAAWHELVSDQNESLLELLQDKAEAVCGFRPSDEHTLSFLQTIAGSGAQPQASTRRTVIPPLEVSKNTKTAGDTEPAQRTLAIVYTIFGETRSAPNASRALVDILRTVVARDPSKLPQLGETVRTRNKQHIGRTPEEINPNRPDLARGDEISPGWLVGLNIDNRDKQMIIDAACEVYGLQTPRDVDVTLPNS